MLLSKTIRLFLGSIGRKDEYEFYLNKFQDHPSTYFALICPDLATIEQMDELLLFDLQFLLKLDLKTALLVAGPDAESIYGHLQSRSELFSFEEDQDAKIRVLYRPENTLEDALSMLIPQVSRRVHMLRIAGGLHDLDGTAVQYFYLKKSDRQALSAEDQQMTRVAEALLVRDPSTHVSISSPMGLMQELFTVKGAGTLVRKGSVIEHVENLSEVDVPRLLKLFSDGFGKELKNAEDLSAVRHFYIDQDYRGAALLEEHAAGLYLSKFVVIKQARGEGLAQELWELACEQQPSLFWRSRHNNPINRWYEKFADGLQHGTHWNVFWRGIEPRYISEIIAYCRERPSDFEESVDQ